MYTDEAVSSDSDSSLVQDGSVRLEFDSERISVAIFRLKLLREDFGPFLPLFLLSWIILSTSSQDLSIFLAVDLGLVSASALRWIYSSSNIFANKLMYSLSLNMLYMYKCIS